MPISFTKEGEGLHGIIISRKTMEPERTRLTRRFSSLRRRNRGNVSLLNGLESAYETARQFMTQIEEEIGVSVEEIVASHVKRS